MKTINSSLIVLNQFKIMRTFVNIYPKFVYLQNNRYISTKTNKNYKIETEPSPPKLSIEEQEEFEQLQRQAVTQEIIKNYNNNDKDKDKDSLDSSRQNKNLSPEYRQTIPEFDGDINPKTGEINGPKQDPIRHGDWSFNGRVTDF